GIGEKTAVPLLLEIGGLDVLYANLDRVAALPVRGAKSLGAKLEAEKAMAFLSRQLATIKTDVDLAFAPEDLQRNPEQVAALTQLYREFGFKSWLVELADVPAAAEDASPSPTPVAAPRNYEVVLTEAAFAVWLARLQQAEVFAFDTETTS